MGVLTAKCRQQVEEVKGVKKSKRSKRSEVPAICCRTTPKFKSAPLRRGVPGAAFFIGQNSRLIRRSDESRHRATHGESLGNRVSAGAVGRRGRFAHGAEYSRCRPCRPLSKMHRAGTPQGGPEGRGWETGKPGRPDLALKLKPRMVGRQMQRAQKTVASRYTLEDAAW